MARIAGVDSSTQSCKVVVLDAGETIADLRKEAFDPDEAGRRGMGFERLDQLALEHLYGTRG